MDDAEYLAIRAQLDSYADMVMRLRAQWSLLPEPALWSGPAHLAAVGQIRQGPQKLAGIGSQLDRAMNECDERIERARAARALW